MAIGEHTHRINNQGIKFTCAHENYDEYDQVYFVLDIRSSDQTIDVISVMKYDVSGYLNLYNIEENLMKRVSRIPTSSESGEPEYVITPFKRHEDFFWSSHQQEVNEGRVKEKDLEKMIICLPHKTAATKRIQEWYRSIKFNNKIIPILENAKTNAQWRGHVSVINRMCRDNNALQVKDYVSSTKKWNINGKSVITKKTALGEAVENHNLDVIKMLVNIGADPNIRDGEEDEYVLYKTLRDESPGAMKTTRFLLSFLEAKADPTGESGSSDVIASSDGKKYWLQQNRDRKTYRKDDLVTMGVPDLPLFLFSLVGQSYAKWKLMKDISCKLANQEVYKRKVYILGGPPGHGKTMAAKELSRVMGDTGPEQDFLKISCANLNSVHELFGGGGAYQGAHVGSELNNFVVSHKDKVGIVNLDEFDRLDSAVCDALFTIFDKGEWVDKRLTKDYQSKILNCRNIIWVLTTNVFDADIMSFHRKEIGTFKKQEWTRIEQKIKKQFKGKIEVQFGPALARRMGPLVPFVPFTKDELVTLTEHEIDQSREQYSKPPEKDSRGHVRLVGNFNFTVDQSVIPLLAEQYDDNQGTTSITDAINEDIHDPINEKHLGGEDLKHTEGSFHLIGTEGEQEIEFRWPLVQCRC